MRIGVLCTQVRLEEKMIFRALRERGVRFDRIDVRSLCLEFGVPLADDLLGNYDAVWLRCVSQTTAMCIAAFVEELGVLAVNPYRVFATCGDKALTTMALVEHGVPTPRVTIAFSQASALAAVEDLGYPVVLKSPVGSWGRLMAKLNDREAAEAVIEHKHALHRDGQAVHYIQEYVVKPGRDIRAVVVGDQTVYAIFRNAAHWITNTARGGVTTNLPAESPSFAAVDRLARAAAAAVGGGIVAVDILEDVDGALTVNEVNHTPEFHGAMQATQVDIAGRMVDYVMRICEEKS